MKARRLKCHNPRTPVIERIAVMVITVNPTMIVMNVSFFRSILSASNPPIGDANRKGSIEAKVKSPTIADLSDFSSMNH